MMPSSPAIRRASLGSANAPRPNMKCLAAGFLPAMTKPLDGPDVAIRNDRNAQPFAHAADGSPVHRRGIALQASSGVDRQPGGAAFGRHFRVLVDRIRAFPPQSQFCRDRHMAGKSRPDRTRRFRGFVSDIAARSRRRHGDSQSAPGSRNSHRSPWPQPHEQWLPRLPCDSRRRRAVELEREARRRQPAVEKFRNMPHEDSPGGNGATDPQEFGDGKRKRSGRALKSPHGCVGDSLHRGENQGWCRWVQHCDD